MVVLRGGSSPKRQSSFRRVHRNGKDGTDPAELLPAKSVVWVCLHVGNMHDFALKQGSSHCRATLRNNWLSSQVLNVGIGHTEFSYTFEHAVPLARDTTLISLAQPHGSLHQRIQYCFEIEGRPAYGLKNVRGRRLLLQRFSQLVEQPRILYGDDGLGSEVLD